MERELEKVLFELFKQQTSQMSESNSQNFGDWIVKAVSKKGLKAKAKQAKNDMEMIKAVKPFFNWNLSTSKEKKKFKKSSSRSMEYAEQAIEEGCYGEKDQSLKLANMITAFAKDDGDIALGHCIRFVLLDILENEHHHQKIEELELCLKNPQLPKKMNLDVTLKNTNGKEFSPNSFDRREMTQVLKELKDKRESPEVKNSEAEAEKQNEKEAKFTRDVFTLKSPNPKAPALEDFVKIKYDTVKGRHLVVTKDVPAGTTLLVERPFVAGIADMFDLEISRCYHCFKKNDFVPIPCGNCVFVLYCSEKCLEESKEYHKKYECCAFPDIGPVVSIISRDSFLCAYSTICTFGPQELFRAFLRQQEQNKSPPTKQKSKNKFKIPGADPETGIYSSSSLYAVAGMGRPSPCCTEGEALISLALIKILGARTNFFQQLKLELESPQMKSQFQNFLTLFLIKVYVSFSTTDSKELNSNFNPFGGNQSIFAYSLQPTHKLTNHSCQHNIGFFETSNLKGLGTACVAAKELKKGEELCRSYKADFSLEKKNVRQRVLLEEYRFVCKCVACLNDWPLMKKLEAEKDRPKFYCPSCSHKIPPEPEMMSKKNFEKISLNSGNNFICLQCKSQYNEQELKSQFKSHSEAVNAAGDLIEDGAGQELLKSLKAASSFFHGYVIPPSYYQEKCRDLIPKAMVNSTVPLYD